MTLKLAQFCDDPPKISTKSSYPKKISIFLKTQKNIEIQNFEPKKNGPCLRMCENGGLPSITLEYLNNNFPRSLRSLYSIYLYIFSSPEPKARW